MVNVEIKWLQFRPPKCVLSFGADSSHCMSPQVARNRKHWLMGREDPHVRRVLTWMRLGFLVRAKQLHVSVRESVIIFSWFWGYFLQLFSYRPPADFMIMFSVYWVEIYFEVFYDNICFGSNGYIQFSCVRVCTSSLAHHLFWYCKGFL